MMNNMYKSSLESILDIVVAWIEHSLLRFPTSLILCILTLFSPSNHNRKPANHDKGWTWISCSQLRVFCRVFNSFEVNQDFLFLSSSYCQHIITTNDSFYKVIIIPSFRQHFSSSKNSFWTKNIKISFL